MKIPLHRLLLLEIFAGVIVNLLVLLIFAKITREVLGQETLFYDRAISGFIYSLRAPVLTTIMIAVSALGSAPSLIVSSLLTVLVLLRKHRKEAATFVLAIIIGCLLDYLLKLIFQLPRPDISPLQILKDPTYPSGHSMNNLVFTGLFAFYVFRFTRNKVISFSMLTAAAAWTLLIGFSRVYLGVHYPSDILAGYSVGFWWLVTVLLIDKTLSLKRLKC